MQARLIRSTFCAATLCVVLKLFLWLSETFKGWKVHIGFPYEEEVDGRGVLGPAWRAFVLSSRSAAELETLESCLYFFLVGLCNQDVAVMGSPRLKEMNHGLRRLSRTHRSPFCDSVFLFGTGELGGSLPGARPRHHSLHGDKHGENRQQQHQHQGSAPFQLHRPNSGRN